MVLLDLQQLQPLVTRQDLRQLLSQLLEPWQRQVLILVVGQRHRQEPPFQEHIQQLAM